MADTQQEPSYYARRMQALGIVPEINKIGIKKSTWIEQPDGSRDNSHVLEDLPIFRESAKGIDILVYALDRFKIWTKGTAQRQKETIETSDKEYCITRLENPIVKTNGDVIKYLKPAKEPSYPFFPPQLVQKYDEQKPIKALYITEGFFKAFKADMHGIDCVGVQSITCLRDKDSNALWADIVTLVATCKVERLVWLTDGDFMNITSKELTEGIDLHKRPNIFYQSVYTFWELTSSLECQRYFAHINSDTLPENPKGLDDMLCTATDTTDIAAEFNNFALLAPGKVYPGTHITRMNITAGTGGVRKYIFHEDVTAFYLYHRERRPELKDIATFMYNGTTYRYNEKDAICEIEVPGDAKKYIRAGNDYFKHIVQPDKKGKPMQVLKGRLKGTITDDHGKNFITHIKKYDDFCIVPDHFNYNPVIHNCYNLYQPFTWEPEDGDCSHTIEFFKHIFSEELVTLKDKQGNVLEQIPRYELGLDYYTIMLKYPGHMLPILCCVSAERQTGKTTLHDYTDELFKGNSINIGNEDLEADFNAHWAGKLVIKVDETKVEKGKVIDKIKRLSTASNIIMNAKGKDQTTLAFFAKFMLNSNHVEDFVRIDKEEIRFWIHQVKPIANLNKDFLQNLIDEIPAFIHFLINRKMVSKPVERHWFDSQLLYTDALKRIKDNSRPAMELRIMEEISDLFDMQPGVDKMYMTLEALSKLLGKADKKWIKRTLNDMGHHAEKTTTRGRYPQRVEVNKAGSLNQVAIRAMDIEYIAFTGKPYIFNRTDFTDSGEVIEAMATTAISNYAAGSEDEKLPFD